jgi:N-acetyl-anhydromuramyl-L-alanine amidase AmpD
VILNRSAECEDGREKLLDLDEAGPVTGYQMPYTFVIGADGEVEQALKLSDFGPHARAWNTKGVGIACVGDFRVDEPPAVQYNALVWLCTVIAKWLPGGANSIYGHDELGGARTDVAKQCPGHRLNMHRLRHHVRAGLVAELTDSGVVL